MKNTQIYILIFCLCLSFFAFGNSISYAKKKEKLPPGTMPMTPASTPQDITWTFEKNAISLHIESTENLNTVNNEAHTVSLCIYQSPDSNTLQALAQSEEGIKELLQCKSIPPDRLQATQLYIQPQTTQDIKMDRAENAKFIAVVAGFNQLSSQNCFAIFPFPVHTETKRKMLIKKETFYYPAKLEARIDLTTDSVQLQGVENVQK